VVTRPTVSVVLPVYNGARFLGAALDSVGAQTCTDFEVIAVDDGSTDGSADLLAARPGVHLIRQANAGQSAARNAGARHARGEFLAFIDQDDEWDPQKLARQLRVFERLPDVGLVYSDLDEVDDAGRVVTRQVLRTCGFRHPKRSLLDCLVEDMFILPSTVMLRKTLFDAAGGFDERLSGYEDDDLFLRCFQRARFHFMRAALVRWRIFSTSSSFSERMDRSRLLYYEKLLAHFPDQPRLHKFYTSEVIVPRFGRSLVALYHTCCEAGDRALARRYRAQFFAHVAPRLGWRYRLALYPAFLPRPLYRGLRLGWRLIRGPASVPPGARTVAPRFAGGPRRHG
jgi:glycosyltransferase involved in cell wall biosynthesis